MFFNPAYWQHAALSLIFCAICGESKMPLESNAFGHDAFDAVFHIIGQLGEEVQPGFFFYLVYLDHIVFQILVMCFVFEQEAHGNGVFPVVDEHDFKETVLGTATWCFPIRLGEALS